MFALFLISVAKNNQNPAEINIVLQISKWIVDIWFSVVNHKIIALILILLTDIDLHVHFFVFHVQR